MDPAQILKLAIVGSIVLIAFSIGLARPPGTILRGLSDTGGNARAMLAMFVALPLFTLLLTWLLPMDPSARVALLALSVSPMPPILPLKERKLGGSLDYALSLQVVASVVALLAAPLMLILGQAIFGRDADLDAVGMARTILVTIVLPLLAGVGVSALMPRQAPALAEALRLGATVLLSGAALVLLWNLAPGLIRAATLPVTLVIVAMVLFGLAVGHLLGGPNEGNRHALAVATASRHPGVAIGLAVSSGIATQQPAVAVVMLHFLAALLLAIPYAKWAKGRT